MIECFFVLGINRLKIGKDDFDMLYFEGLSGEIGSEIDERLNFLCVVFVGKDNEMN